MTGRAMVALESGQSRRSFLNWLAASPLLAMSGVHAQTPLMIFPGPAAAIASYLAARYSRAGQWRCPGTQ